MEISAFSPASIWNNVTRSLTNFGSGALASSTLAQQTIAAGASVDFRAAAGLVGLFTIAAKTGAAATLSIAIQMWDTVNAIPVATSAAAANSTVAFTGVTNNASGLRLLNNDGANSGTYMFAGIILTI